MEAKNCTSLGDMSYRMREEYDIPEPPDEEEDPQVQQTGPRYSSNEARDGPFHKDN